MVDWFEPSGQDRQGTIDLFKEGLLGENDPDFLERYGKQKDIIIGEKADTRGEYGLGVGEMRELEQDWQLYDAQNWKRWNVQEGILRGIKGISAIKERRDHGFFSEKENKELQESIDTRVSEWKSMLPEESHGFFDKAVDVLTSGKNTSYAMQKAEYELTDLFTEQGSLPGFRTKGGPLEIRRIEDKVMDGFIQQDNKYIMGE